VRLEETFLLLGRHGLAPALPEKLSGEGAARRVHQLARGRGAARDPDRRSAFVEHFEGEEGAAEAHARGELVAREVFHLDVRHEIAVVEPQIHH
jgi:hypothetical protein